MNLWIRSQDKEHLELTTYLQVGKIIKNDKELYFIEGGEILGYYKTKKRALEVLDDISEFIKNLYLVEVFPLMKPEYIEKIEKKLKDKYSGEFIMQPHGTKIEPINSNLMFYQMPKE